MGERRGKQRGAAAVEFALAIPVVLMATAGGVSLGRSLMTRHDLAAATNYAARGAAIASGGDPARVNPAAVEAAVRAYMHNEVLQCSNLTVETKTSGIPVPYPNGKALQVTSTCTLKPILNADWASLNVPFVRATAAMPLL